MSSVGNQSSTQRKATELLRVRQAAPKLPTVTGSFWPMADGAITRFRTHSVARRRTKRTPRFEATSACIVYSKT